MACLAASATGPLEAPMVRKPILYIIPGFSPAAGETARSVSATSARSDFPDIINPERASQSFAYPPGHAPVAESPRSVDHLIGADGYPEALAEAEKRLEERQQEWASRSPL